MALKLIEGFDHKSTIAKLSAKGWNQVIFNLGGANVAFSLISGRLAGQAVRFQDVSASGNAGKLRKVLPSTQISGVIGFAFRLSALPSAVTEVAYLEAATIRILRVMITPTGNIRLLNSSGTTLGTGTYSITTNNWIYVEIKWFANGASGTVETKVNNSSDIASVTANIGSTAVDSVNIGIQSSLQGTAFLIDFDDLYILDLTGSAPNNTFLGDVRVSTLYPTADGSSSQWTPDTGTAHFSRINEASGTFPDDDTSYVSDGTVGHRDNYVFGDLPSLTGNVYGVQTVVYARKDDAGIKQIAAVARPVSTDRDGSTVTLTTTYADYTEIRETNPDTSAAWVISEVNASQFGVKVVS